MLQRNGGGDRIGDEETDTGDASNSAGQGEWARCEANGQPCSSLPHASRRIDSSQQLNSPLVHVTSNAFDAIPFAHSQSRSTLHPFQRRRRLPRSVRPHTVHLAHRSCLIRRHGAVHRKAFARGRSQEARTDAAREG